MTVGGARPSRDAGGAARPAGQQVTGGDASADSGIAMWWKEPETGEGAVTGGCAAERAWRSASSTLCAPRADEAWRQIQLASPPQLIWHSLGNCIAYQAGVWQSLLAKGMPDVVQPAAFKLALVLRHTPPELALALLTDLLKQHPQSQDLTSYVLALLTEAEASGGYSPGSPPGPAPLRDLQLFADCELAVLAAPRAQYDAHAALVRAEYDKLTQHQFLELRIKVLNQLLKIPKLYHTPEFEPLEAAARKNIEREIAGLKQQLGSTSRDAEEC